MKSKPKTDEYKNFQTALSQVLRVSHEEMKASLEAEKQAKREQKKRPSDRDSSDKD